MISPGTALGSEELLDRALVEKLSDELGCDVRLEQSNPQTLISGRCVLALPGGSFACWSTNEIDSSRVERHAECVLERELANIENARLRIEVDSLASQVVQDFEELSLIRTLAAHLDIPQTQEETQHFVLESLGNLVGGVGAVSIAAVLHNGAEGEKCDPVWTNDSLVTADQMHALIERYEGDLKKQPVVYNRKPDVTNDIPSALDAFVMVECSSEGRLHGWIVACNRIEERRKNVPWAQLGFTTVQASLMETAVNQLAAQLNNVRLLRQKEELFTDVIRALVNAVEARDPYTCGHSERVAGFARCLGAKIGFSASECERIYLTGLLHDVGKIAIPDGVLQKPSRLNEQERAIIETHTDSGWRILQELDALQDVLPGVLYHHEHWDGNGYPDQLVGENIPIDGRLLAVCDAFDAMTSDRPYRRGMSIEKAVEILNDGAGSYWDPRLVLAFTENIHEMDEIRCSYHPRRPATRPEPVDGKPVIGLPVFPLAAHSESMS